MTADQKKKNAIYARKGNDHRQSRCKRRKLGRQSKDKRNELDLARMRKAMGLSTHAEEKN